MKKARLNREFAIRYIGVGLFMLGFAGWFLYDGMVAWPRANKVLEDLRDKLCVECDMGVTPEEWLNSDAVKTQTRLEEFFGGEKVPSKLYDSLREIEEPKGASEEARRERALQARRVFEEPIYSDAKLQEQYIFAGVAFIAAFWLFVSVFRKKDNEYIASEEGLSGSGFDNEKIAWDEIENVDYSKWDDKSILSVSAKGKKFVLDGWFYAPMRPIVNMITQREIRKLAKEKSAIILAHNYCLPEVQDVADFTGDSLELARKAAECKAPVILFAGVRFMAETAKILSPDSKVLHPAPEALCPMAETASKESVREARTKNPDAVCVAYVNTTAETKSEVDICCTSGNAEKVIASIPKDKQILFLPDKNLGANIEAKLSREMELWQGCCPIHDAITTKCIESAKLKHPKAIVMVHPECRPEVVAVADIALSTGKMLSYVKDSPNQDFVVGTEIGIIHRLKKENPSKNFYPLDPEPICEDMKKLTLEKIHHSLITLTPEITLTSEIISKSKSSIERMLKI